MSPFLVGASSPRHEGAGYATRAFGRVNAPRPAVHRAAVSAVAVARWRVPPGMRSEVHAFEARGAAGSGVP
ncbi:hypothetical protein ACFZAG_24310 [Streptomyces sp. NPDC012403]|uniref:hypothetical protein n=1 Tax=Streptomyces sp. NPDC012403 TaxID=3364831 RepID=UPI0036ED26C8